MNSRLAIAPWWVRSHFLQCATQTGFKKVSIRLLPHTQVWHYKVNRVHHLLPMTALTLKSPLTAIQAAIYEVTGLTTVAEVQAMYSNMNLAKKAEWFAIWAVEARCYSQRERAQAEIKANAASPDPSIIAPSCAPKNYFSPEIMMLLGKKADADMQRARKGEATNTDIVFPLENTHFENDFLLSYCSKTRTYTLMERGGFRPYAQGPKRVVKSVLMTLIYNPNMDDATRLQELSRALRYWDLSSRYSSPLKSGSSVPWVCNAINYGKTRRWAYRPSTSQASWSDDGARAYRELVNPEAFPHLD